MLVTIFFPAEDVQAKAKPKLSITNKTMYVGKTAVITLKNAGKVKWKNSKKSVVTITKKKKNKVSIKARDFFQITDYGLVTMTWGPSCSDWSQTATVKAILEDGRVLTAKVTCYAEFNIYTNELFQKFENQYITAGMTDKEKADDERYEWRTFQSL